MPEYIVMVQNVEGNEDNTSVTGTVNKVQVAAVVKTARLPRQPAERTRFLDNALVDAFLARPAPGSTAVGHTVSRP